MAERLLTKLECRLCGRYGTHGFDKDKRGVTCKAAKACYRRWVERYAPSGFWPVGKDRAKAFREAADNEESDG